MNKNEKRWTKLECEEYYVFNASITLEELSKRSNVPESTLISWSAKHEWFKRRQRNLVEIQKRVDEKIIENVSTKISITREELIISQINDVRNFRQVISIWIEYFLKQLSISNHPEHIEGVFGRISFSSLTYISQILDRMITLERKLFGIKEEDKVFDDEPVVEEIDIESKSAEELASLYRERLKTKV